MYRLTSKFEHIFICSFLLIIFQIGIKAQEKLFYTDQVDTIFQYLDKNIITTGVLYDRAFPSSRFDFFNPNEDTATFEFAEQAYYELYQAHYNRSLLLHPTILTDIVEYENLRSRIPILILDYYYNKIDTMALDDNLISYQNGLFYDVPGRPRSPYWQQRLQLAMPMAEVVKNTEVTFIIAPIFISRNTGLNVQSVTINTGNGIYTLTGPQDSVTVSFSSPGTKTITVLVTLSNGSSFSTKSYVDIGNGGISSRLLAGPSEPCFKKTITADIAFQGYDETEAFRGQFTANYYYRTNDGTVCDQTEKPLRKPIILIDGFDPTDKRDAKAIYDQFLFYVDDVTNPNSPSTEFIAPQLRSQGYDIIMVDIPTYLITNGGQYISLPPNANPPLPWDPLFGAWHTGKVIRGGGDYVQRNAFTLVKLIQQINAELAAQSSTEQLVIIGPSMGGQISRYALRWMELNNQNHNCRLWVSFDSNHEGAILPIGQQYFIDYLSGAVSAAKRGRDRQINSPASKQFLIDHYLAHTQGSITPAGAPGFFQPYYNELNAMGWPQNCRKISMISGAENGTPQNTPQGGELSYQHILKLNRKSGLLLPLWGGFLWGLPDIEVLNAKIYVAPTISQGSGIVFDAKATVLINIFSGLSSSQKYAAAATAFCRNQSLETIQGGYYWGYKELAESSGGNKSVVPNTARTIRQFISYPKGYHTHHTTFGDLAVGQGTGTNQNRKWDDDVSEINLVCDTQEIPFDAYFGPTFYSVKHDSLFYWQARYLIDEINGIYMPIKTIYRNIQGNISGAMCPGDRRTFQILNTKPGQTFTWSTSHPNIAIINGQGTSSIEIEYTGGNVVGQAYIQLQSTHTCYLFNINNLLLNIAFTNGPPGSNTLVPLYSTEGYSNWLQDINCLKTYTFPGFYSGEISLSDPVATSYEWTYISKYPNTAHVSISYTDPRYATVTVKPSGAWVIYRLTISNACGIYSHEYKFVANGICVSGPERNVINENNDLYIIPNPVTESFTVGLKSQKTGSSIKEVVIRNSTGAIVKRLRHTFTSPSKLINIQLFPSGVYTVHVYDGNKWYMGKMIKQ